MSSTKRIDLGAIEMPSDEEILQRAQQRYIAAANNPNCFANWFPAVQELGLRSPKSDWFPVTSDQQMEIMTENEARMRKAMKPVADKVRAFGDQHGYPLFIKNSLFSAKHSWKDSCFIRDENADIEMQIALIFYEWEIVGMFGGVARHLVVREMIETDPAFIAFNGMPVTQEFRLFADKGKTYAYQPYWPEMAIQKPSTEDWQENLKQISTPTEELLAEMTEMANKITGALGDDYSVDFLIDADGRPWLIDMALSETSFKCETGYVDLAA